MSRIRVRVGVGAVALLLSYAIGAQPTPLQSLKDTWVGTTQDLFQVDYDGLKLVPKTPTDNVVRNFSAIVFEQPTLGAAGAAVRNLIAVDGTKLLRYPNGGDIDGPPADLFDASKEPSSLKSVTAIGVTETGSVLFAGYSRPKRVFELWELTERGSEMPLVQLRSSGTPNLTDASYVKAEDVAPDSVLAGGGLLATAGRQVLFFSADSNFAMTALFDAKQLPIQANTQLLSVDLVPKTDVLMLATSDRTLLTSTPTTPAVATPFAVLPDLGNCRNLKSQRILVRSARGSGQASSVVSDVCGQVLRYDFSNPFSMSNVATSTILASGLVLLAVGEGNEIHCDPHSTCELTTGLTANIDSSSTAELLVLQFDDLCDPQISTAPCYDASASGSVTLNSLLPQSVRDRIDPRVSIKLPSYMSSSSFNGRFGVLLVQADPITATSAATVELEYRELGSHVKLDVAVGLPRPTPILTLLNQDVAAYAPDNYGLPTVRGFEATPITTGVRNPMTAVLRGFSAIFYGLQYDVSPASGRAFAGGIYPSVNDNGQTPTWCPDLVYGTQVFPILDLQGRYFANLAACLFSDLETLLGKVIPATALNATDRATLQARLGNTKDKLIKALTSSGPNSGSENFQSVISQLDNFDLAVPTVSFDPDYVIYRNELLARSKVFRFNLLERTYPSMPLNGF
jgi:hypothetical protein